jgi:hypothetical protein
MRTTTFTLEAKQMGRRATLVPSWTLALEYETNLTLRDLITRVVIEEVNAFKQRQRDTKFVRVLTEQQIEQGEEVGKIDAGGREDQQDINPAQAIQTALQAFDDGLYYVFINDQQITALSDTIAFQPQLEVLFLRLVALAGG